MSGRNSQLARTFNILEMLDGSSTGLSANEIHKLLVDKGWSVEKRTVYRDLEGLQAAGFPLTAKGKSMENGDRWVLERNARISDYLVMSSRELIALYMAKSMLTPLRDTPFFNDLTTAFNKIEEKIGTKGKAFIDELAGELHFEPGPKWGLGVDSTLIDTVRAACQEQQLLSLTYTSVNSKSTTPREIGPHYLYFAKGALYLVGEDLKDNKVKVFAVARMRDVTMLDKPYEGTPTDPAEYFKDSFGVFRGDGPVAIQAKFAPQIASYVRERSWHPSQRVVANSDGSIDLHLEVAITPELVQWLLGFGGHVTVASPAVLSDKLRTEAMAVVERYASTKKAS